MSLRRVSSLPDIKNMPLNNPSACSELQLVEKFEVVMKTSKSTISSESSQKILTPSVPKVFGSPKHILNFYRDQLADYEKSEITQFVSVHFLGATRRKFTRVVNLKNRHFDDRDGHYEFLIRDHIGYRFEVLELLGKGSYANVLRAYDHKTQKQVAIKVVKFVKGFQSLAFDEIVILEHLRRADTLDNMHVILLQDHFMFRHHFCLVFPLTSINLHELLKKNDRAGLNLKFIREISQQLIVCLNFLKKLKIIHCDLKTDNVVLVEEGHTMIKVIDFGNSCYEYKLLARVVQARPFRAPEVVFRQRYTCAIDMWSLGCIIMELFTGHLLFSIFEEDELVERISTLIGRPSETVMNSSVEARRYFSAEKSICGCAGALFKQAQLKIACRRNELTLSDILSDNDQLLSFVEKCLTWSPKERITPHEALTHPWIMDTVEQQIPAGNVHLSKYLRDIRKQKKVRRNSI